MANVYDVANFFVDIANGCDDDLITNLKLNKLLYFAQGVYASRTNKRLFDDEIEAWQFGPVVPAIYHKYKKYCSNPIDRVDVDYDASIFSNEELNALIDVMREYGKYTGSTLVSITHEENSPWSNTVSKNESVISFNEIKRYFRERPVNSISYNKFISPVSKLPNEWYDASEDAEWEAYL